MIRTVPKFVSNFNFRHLCMLLMIECQLLMERPCPVHNLFSRIWWTWSLEEIPEDKGEQMLVRREREAAVARDVCLPIPQNSRTPRSKFEPSKAVRPTARPPARPVPFRIDEQSTASSPARHHGSTTGIFEAGWLEVCHSAEVVANSWETSQPYIFLFMVNILVCLTNDYTWLLLIAVSLLSALSTFYHLL